MNPDSKRRLLLVEDEPVAAVTTSAMLKRNGYDVVSVGTGLKAIEVMSSDISIELILMDIDLGPGMSGPEAAREILASRDIPIVFLTSHSEREMVYKVRAITRYGYVIKNSGDFVLLSSIEMAFELFESHIQLKASTEQLAQSEKSIRKKLDNILLPDAGVEPLALEELIDVAKLQSISDDFYKISGMPIGIFNIEGECLVATGWQDICTKFHRANPESVKCCIESDTMLTRDVSPGEFREYKCRNNMRDIVTPIMQGDRHIGNIFLGQFFYEDETVDEEVFIAQAEKYGYDKEAYLEALSRVPRWSRDKVKASLSYYIKLADVISQLGFSNIKLARAVAERDRVNDALTEKSSLFSMITDNMIDLIFMMDTDLRFKYVSPSILKYLGYTEQELIGLPILEYVHPHDRDMVNGNLENLFKTGCARAEYRCRDKNGTYQWYESMGKTLRDDNGSINGAVVASREISDRKEAEITLRENEEKFSVAFYSSPVLMAISDIETGRYIEVNNSFCSTLGFTRIEVVGKTSTELGILASDARASIMEDLLPSGRIAGRVLEVHKKNGERVFCSFNGEIITLGGVKKFLTIAENITERIESENRLRESEELFSRAFQSGPLIMSLNDYSTGIYLEVNDNFCRVLGFSRDDVLGKSPLDLGIISGDGRRCLLEKISTTGNISGLEIDFYRKNGELMKSLYFCETIAISGRKMILSIVQNITEQKFAADERGATVELISLLNSSEDLYALMNSVIRFFKNWSGCEAVAVRMKEGNDYPYYVVNGFPDEFVRLESSLCVRDIDGQLIRDEIGNPVLDCMCGNIIQGRFDPSKPFFTRHGSFWTNSTTELLASTTETDRQARTRNRCNGEGYESVALIPLRYESVTYGLIQLNDLRRGRFTPEFIELFERFADSISIYLSQKLARKKLEESESRYRLLVNKSPLYIFLARNGKYIFANQSGAMRMGFGSPDDVIGLSIDEQISPESLEFVRGRISDASHGMENRPVELKMIAPDGSSYTTESVSVPVTLDDGPAVMIIGRDITEEKLMQRKLVESGEKYRMVADFTFDWEFWIGEDCSMKYVSPSCEKISGYTASEFMERPELLSEIILAGDSNCPCYGTEHIAEIPDSSESEFRIRTRNGEIKWIAHTCRAVYDATGKFAGRRGSNRDITAKHEIQEELHRTYDRLESLWNIARLWDADIKTISDYIIDAVTRITASPYGFYGFVNDDESDMTINSWSGKVMADCLIADKQLVYKLSECGIWAEAVRHRNDLIINDYNSEYSAKKGYPDGHISIERLMVVPLVRSGKVISVAVVGNKADDYTEHDVVILKTFLANVQTIVDRRKSVDALRDSEQKLKSLMNSSSDLVLLIDRDGIILEANSIFTENTGRTNEEAIGTNIYSMMPDDVAERRRRFVDEAVKSRASTHFEEERNGLLLYSNVSPVVNSAGEVISVAVFSRDITDERKLFKSLQESESFTGGILNSLTATIAVIDSSGVIIHVNEAWRNFAENNGGGDRNGYLGENYLDILEKATAEDGDEYAGSSLKGISSVLMNENETFELEYPCNSPDEERWFIMRVSRFYTGISAYCVISHINITERKTAEREIKALLEQKEMLLCEVHHRIKNNMNTIAGLLKLQSISMTEQTAVDALNDARSRVQNMMLIYDKLYRSADHTSLHVREYFEALIDEIVKIFPNNKIVRIVKNIEDFSLDSRVLFTMGIMINELITNAFKYAFDKVPEPELDFSLRKDEQKIVFSIRDNGRGLPEKIIKGEREGFGLNLVSSLAEQLEGEMSIGKGPGAEIIVTILLEQ